MSVKGWLYGMLALVAFAILFVSSVIMMMWTLFVAGRLSEVGLRAIGMI